MNLWFVSYIVAISILAPPVRAGAFLMPSGGEALDLCLCFGLHRLLHQWSGGTGPEVLHRDRNAERRMGADPDPSAG